MSNANTNAATPPYRTKPSARWREHFRHNGQSLLELPWARGAQVTDAERDAIASSVQEFQLGESSEGKNLARSAMRYAERTGDFDYVPALGLFMAEEHRHARDLGRFLDLAGVPRVGKAWPDTVFRWLRRGAGLELSVAVLVTAEVIAKVYYAALREATGSALLRRLCDQILRDEVTHVHFQTERLAILRRGRRRWLVAAGSALHRLFMAGTCLVVWHKHGRAMRHGGWTFGRFWRDTWREMREALRRMDPANYAFEPGASPAATPPAAAPAALAEAPA